MPAEHGILLAGLAGYGLAAVLAALAGLRRAPRFELPMVVLGLALLLHGAAILLRWARLGHGPYVDLFEVLSSNVWSLNLALLVAASAFRPLRPMLALAQPALLVGVLWLFSLTPADTLLPVTYATPWLAVHVWLGKVFLGLLLVAAASGLVVLARRAPLGAAPAGFAAMPGSAALEAFAYRCVLGAFVFESLMILAGALWARDAWGRYWAWDPLETWAFSTWLMVVIYLHLRATRRPPPAVSAVLVVGLFVLAFSTLFGMPFVTTAPHKGAI